MGSAEVKKLFTWEAVDNAAPINGKSVKTAIFENEYVGFVKLKDYAGSGNVDVKIQHSPDGGTTWVDLVTFTALTADGSEVKDIAATSKVFPLIRGVITTAAGVTAGAIDLRLLNNRFK